MTEVLPIQESIENQESVLSTRINGIIESLDNGAGSVHEKGAKTGLPNQERWPHAFPMIASMIAALEIDAKERIDTSTFNGLVDSQPFKGMKIVDVGFGSSNRISPAVTIFLPHLGARMYGVEPNADNIKGVQRYLPEEDKENLKAGVGQDVPELFPGTQFDMVISNRLVEEWPMAGEGSLKNGVALAERILKRTGESLKERGFSIHVTTAPFIVSREALQRMGYEVLIWNGRFEPGLGHGTYNFTILRKGI